MSEKEIIAYTAGLVDGEGTFWRGMTTNGRGERSLQSRIIVTQKDPAMLLWLQEKYGGGVPALNDMRPKRIAPGFHCTICAYPVSRMREWLSCPMHLNYVDEEELAKEEIATPRGKRILDWLKKGLKSHNQCSKTRNI